MYRPFNAVSRKLRRSAPVEDDGVGFLLFKSVSVQFREFGVNEGGRGGRRGGGGGVTSLQVYLSSLAKSSSVWLSLWSVMYCMSFWH